MIPIKKLKAQVVEEFKAMELTLLERIIMKRGKYTGRHFTVPSIMACGVRADIRYNIKAKKFDRIDFNAFGKNHRIKL